MSTLQQTLSPGLRLMAALCLMPLKLQWVPHDRRDQVVDFVRRWSEQTEIAAARLVGWAGLARRLFRFRLPPHFGGWLLAAQKRGPTHIGWRRGLRQS
jgi:hypothetical protein